MRHEVADSRARLQDRTGLPIASFAYPHGYSDARVRRVVREAGFTSACSVKNALSPPRDRPYTLARLMVMSTTTDADLHGWLAGRGVPVGQADERLLTVGLALVPPRPRSRRHGAASRPDGPMRPDGAVHTVHPALLRAFGALDGAGVAWCLLRGEARLADPPGDVDLLVAPADLPRLDAVLAAVGLPARPRRGEGRAPRLRGPDAASDRFFELDVESSVEFGPSAHFAVNWLRPTLRTDAATALLAGRRRVGPLAVPGADDGFWALLLHCIVDKRAVADRHAARLVELAPQARPDGVLGRIVTAHCPSGWDAARVLTAARDSDWPALVAVGARLPGRATAVESGGRAGPRAAQARPRTSAAPAAASRSPCSGPTARASPPSPRASRRRSACPPASSTWDCGRARTVPPGPLAARRAGRGPPPVPVVAARGRHRLAPGPGRLVVLDRHPYDALLPPAPPHVALKRLFFTLLARTVPAPSLVLILDVPAEVAAFRRPEEDPGALATLRSEYLALARRLPRAVVLDADRPPEALRAAAIDRIWQAVLDAETRR